MWSNTDGQIVRALRRWLSTLGTRHCWNTTTQCPRRKPILLQVPATRGKEQCFLSLSHFVSWLEVLPLTPGQSCSSSVYIFLRGHVGKPRQSQIAHCSLITDCSVWWSPLGKIEWFWELGHRQWKIHTEGSHRNLAPSSFRGGEEGGGRRQRAGEQDGDRKSGFLLSLLLSMEKSLQSNAPKHGKVPPKQWNCPDVSGGL